MFSKTSNSPNSLDKIPTIKKLKPGYEDYKTKILESLENHKRGYVKHDGHKDGHKSKRFIVPFLAGRKRKTQYKRSRRNNKKTRKLNIISKV